MQYESIILELMTRIKKLEDEVAQLKERLDAPEVPTESVPLPPSAPAPADDPTDRRGRTTDEMLQRCYDCGQQAHREQTADLMALARQVAAETGMNQSSAYIYIYVVQCMLEGVSYKRAINARATALYLEKIRADCGEAGLESALQALAGHIAYRKRLGHTVTSLEALWQQHSR